MAHPPKTWLSKDERDIRELFNVARRAENIERVNSLWPKVMEARSKFANQRGYGEVLVLKVQLRDDSLKRKASCLKADLEDLGWEGGPKASPVKAVAFHDFLFDIEPPDLDLPPAEAEGQTIPVLISDGDQDEVQIIVLRKFIQEKLGPQP